jgi:hypothetical protein
MMMVITEADPTPPIREPAPRIVIPPMVNNKDKDSY